ncbi:MAG: S41 family peptidase [Lachnospiraceae bacterium]|nr:S41 family peptidase [Lachnospiraceae bacterium]
MEPNKNETTPNNNPAANAEKPAAETAAANTSKPGAPNPVPRNVLAKPGAVPPKGAMPPRPGAMPPKQGAAKKHNYYKMMMTVIDTIKQDYAGFQEKEEINDTKYPMNMLVYAYQKHMVNEVMFLRIVSEYLASLGDPNLKFSMINHGNYKNNTVGFRARRYGDDLYVTEVGRDDRLKLGDKITKLDKYTPSEHRTKIPKNFMTGNTPEREQWGGFLKMFPTFDVEHADGTTENMKFRHFIIEKPKRKLEFESLNEKTFYICIEEFSQNTADLEKAIEEHASELTSCENLIIDLRKNEAGTEPGFVPLLPMIFDSEEELGTLLLKEAIYTNYSEKNCEHTTTKIENMKARYEKAKNEEAVALADQLIAEFKEKSGKGFQKDVPEDDILAEYHEIHEGKEGLYNQIRKVILITDTWCRDAGEVFVKICSASDKVTVIGRPTMGTIDYTNYVNASIDKTFILSYPMSKRQNVVDGHPYNETGLPVDVYIPWTPQECTEDLLRQKALELLEA